MDWAVQSAAEAEAGSRAKVVSKPLRIWLNWMACSGALSAGLEAQACKVAR